MCERTLRVRWRLDRRGVRGAYVAAEPCRVALTPAGVAFAALPANTLVHGSIGGSGSEWLYYNVSLPSLSNPGAYVQLDVAVLDGATLPVYAGFGSMPNATWYTRADTGNTPRKALTLDMPPSGAWFFGLYADTPATFTIRYVSPSALHPPRSCQVHACSALP